MSEPPSEKFSWEHSVKQKILKNFWPQIWHDQKSWCTDPSSPKTKTNLETRLLSKGKKIFDPKFGKKVGGWTPPTYSESRVLCIGRNSENFLTSNLEWPKKVGEQTPLPRIQSPECSVKEEIPKTFWPQIWHDLKKLVPRPSPSPKNWNSRVLYKGKNSENILTSHLAWPKKVGAWTSPDNFRVQST